MKQERKFERKVKRTENERTKLNLVKWKNIGEDDDTDEKTSVTNGDVNIKDVIKEDIGISDESKDRFGNIELHK